MKTVIINGQNHKGSTYHIGKLLADKIGGEVTEFFFRGISPTTVSAVRSVSVWQQISVRILKNNSPF